ncbi:MAG: family 16 glycosylhydrolase [Saonia sp.]
MKLLNKYGLLLLISMAVIMACQEDEPSLNAILVPTNLELGALVEADQSGIVTVTPTAENALNFHVFFNPGVDPIVISAGQSATFRYTQSGQYSTPVTVVAFGAGGVSSSKTVLVDLDVRLFIDAETLAFIGGAGTKRWVWNQTVGGHFGVGPTTNDFPEFFSAGPDQLNPCLYDDVLEFSFDADDNYTFRLETGNANETFINWTEVTQFFPNATPQEFADECRDITDQISMDTDFIIFTDDTGKRFIDVENSMLSYWSGAEIYEVVELSENLLVVRGIQEVPDGSGELAWYHTFVPEGFDPNADEVLESVFTNMIWSDEFDIDGAPDPLVWGYDLGDGCPDLCGWGNNESQYYTDRTDNVIVEDGLLKITAKREDFMGSEYTSTRIQSYQNFEFTYGRVEVRAKLPTGVGTWPAIWMLGADFETNPWPAAGEIDIMEHVGREQDVVLGTTHDPNNFAGDARTGSTTVPGASDDFHVYGIEWTETEIKFFIDNIVFHTVSNDDTLPFNKDFFFIMNIAMGGTLGGPIDAAFMESTMEVDYIRLYQ